LVLNSATKHVIEWLVDNPQVERFYIANCKLSDKSALQLSKIMNDSKLTILDIRNCSLGTRSLKAITTALAANRRLTELHLSGNKISKKVGQLLADAVDVHRSLSVLALRNCDLRKSTLILLLKALKKDKNIRVLDLALNTDLGSSSVCK
jgi:Ran GTPase-activating protein (RanGAP) involved in mRNA processing and transport